MTERDRLIYALMFLEIGDDISICDAHSLIQSVLHESDVPCDVCGRIAERALALASVSGLSLRGCWQPRCKKPEVPHGRQAYRSLIA